MHARHLGSRNQSARARAVVEPRDQQTCGALEQLLAQQQLFLRAVVMRDADQCLKAFGALSLLRCIEQINEERFGEFWDQYRHMIAAL